MIEVGFTEIILIFGIALIELGPERMAAQARAYGLCATDPPEQTTCEEQLVTFELPFANGRFPEKSSAAYVHG